jgi:hypothetical protein
MPLYIDDVLSDESKAAVEEHLTGCSECRQYFRKMHDDDIPDSDAMHEEIINRLDEAESLKKLKRSILLKRIITIAVTAAVVIGLVIAGDILIYHNPKYISYEEAGIRMTENGDMYVEKPYYGYKGVYWGKDGKGNRITIFFLTSSYYSRNWGKVSDDNRQHVMRFHATEDPDAVDKVYYLPEKYVKENRLQGLFSKDNTLFDHIYRQSTKLGEEQMQAEIDKLIAEIEGEATVVWSAE